ncbi:hypothetical protein B0H13DRAFT_2031678 [Mycena leptocephala]|nr:hypothetical protein B0H13DRAFT_2031678 [Mycena leptocephala]
MSTDPSYNESSFIQSPFCGHFNTNYVPSDAEIDRIRAYLAPHEAKLARLQSLIHDLTVQQDRVKAHIDSHRALMSYPRRLPQDVVEQIFLACLPTRHNSVMSVAEAPLLLGHICSAWRSIAFAMPRLWASLHISVDFVDSEEEKAAAIVDWLTRAASLPLAISVTRNSYYCDYQAVVNLLIPFSARWYALHLSNIPMEYFFLLAAVNTPLLADIQITLQSGLDEDEGNQVLASNIFHGMNLQKVTITSPDPRPLVPTTPFTWDHLTDLTLEHTLRESSWTLGFLDCETAYRLLKGCTRLRSLKFPIEPSAQQVNEPLLLTSLESLIIVNHYTSFEVFEHLVDQLVMPQLCQFHVTSLNSNSAPAISTTAFLEPSLMRGLQLFPLWTPDNQWTPSQLNAAELLEILSPDAEASNPCPALKKLILESEDTSLRGFHLHAWSHDPPDIIPDVESFLARGLDVSLRYTPLSTSASPTPWQGIAL